MKKLIVFLLCAVLFHATKIWAAETNLVVHEWGTFTSLQNEDGDAIGGINTDDEPVPDFVHRLANYLLLRPTEVPNGFFQGAPSCHPDVTMRMETPIIYFHLPEGIKTAEASVRVRFRGGWLTEYYPNAHPNAPGFRDYNSSQFGIPARLFQFGPLTSATESSLSWDNLKIGGNWPLTNTTEHVWTSPRAVLAASVQATNGESEKFLFYRGVAHIDAPLKVSRDRSTSELLFRSQLNSLPATTLPPVKSIWLVDVKSNGKVAFRTLPSLTLNTNSNKILTHTPAEFASSEFSSANLNKLKATLQTALITEGLFEDEAQALLNTWELSYFKSSGLRVFFLVPRAWTDFYLPLDISVPNEISRVMVGRIELITPQQRQGLKKLASFSSAQISDDRSQLFTNFYGKITFNSMFGNTKEPTRQEVEKMNKDLAQVNAGQRALASFVSVPRSYQIYLDLGRFRNALILDEAKRQNHLTNFISNYVLEAYRTEEVPALPSRQ